MFTSFLAYWLLLFSQTQVNSEVQSAQDYYTQRKFAEAAQLACRATTKEPNNFSAWKLCGLSLQLTQQLQLAEETFQAATARFHTEAELWFYLARVQYLQGKLQPSAGAAQKSLELREDNADAHTQLALSLDAQSEPENALKHYKRAVQLNQKLERRVTVPLIYGADLLQRMGRYSEAYEYLTQAITMNPSSSTLLFNRGRVEEKRGRVIEAKKDYQESIKIDNNPQAVAALERLKTVTDVASTKPTRQEMAPIKFRNIAAQANLNFILRNSATPRKYQIETMTGGVGIIDYDNDGWQDIYFVNGAELPSLQKTEPKYWNRLFRNNRDGTFSDVTEAAGVKGKGYSMGVAVADYDNDGNQDLYVTGVNHNQLYRNLGNGKFSDVTEQAKLSGNDFRDSSPAPKPWSVSAAWIDYDNDGNLDLFIVNYCRWNLTTDPYCGQMKDGYRTYCFPDRYEGLPNQLFRNNGDGTFTNVSQQMGISQHIGKGMGVSLADYNNDGYLDIFVANDTLPNFLFHNQKGKGLEEVGFQAGVALADNGKPVSGMGTDFRDYDNDGLPDVIVSALEGETFPLFRNLGKGFFTDMTWTSELGKHSIKRSGWSLGMFDFNNDGWKDLFATNAHVNDNQELYNEQTYRQTNSLYQNLGTGLWRDVSSEVGNDFQKRAAHRGAAFADFNRDGKIDVVTTALNEPAELWLNESPLNHRWLQVQLIGTVSNRSGVGAKISLHTLSGNQFNHLSSSVGYASSSQLLLHFGVGNESTVKQLTVIWPGGARQSLEGVPTNQVLKIVEPIERRK